MIQLKDIHGVSLGSPHAELADALATAWHLSAEMGEEVRVVQLSDNDTIATIKAYP
jgi:hypothetical protein